LFKNNFKNQLKKI